MTLPLRSQIKNALMELVRPATFPEAINGHSTWVTVSRKLKTFESVDPAMQPAIYIVQHREGYDSRGVGLPPRRWLEIGLWCYAPAPESVIGDDLLDGMLQAIESRMVPDNPQQNTLTLGGLAYQVNIWRQSNLFIRDPGDLDGQALLVVPVRVLMP